MICEKCNSEMRVISEIEKLDIIMQIYECKCGARLTDITTEDIERFKEFCVENKIKI